MTDKINRDLLGLFLERLINQISNPIDCIDIIVFFGLIQSQGQGRPRSPTLAEEDPDCRSYILLFKIIFKCRLGCFGYV